MGFLVLGHFFLSRGVLLREFLRSVITRLHQALRNYEAHHHVIQDFGRNNFKIDHLIPLCAGGANTDDNLWPQHQTVYEKTDKIEGVLCEVMASGRLLQAQAIALVLDVKHNPETADDALEELQNMLSVRSFAFPTPFVTDFP